MLKYDISLFIRSEKLHKWPRSPRMTWYVSGSKTVLAVGPAPAEVVDRVGSTVYIFYYFL